MNRRYLNLIVHDFRSHIYSLCCIDACKHLFYGDSEIAQRAALAARENKSKRGEIAALGGWRKLPPPVINFQASPSWRNSNLYYLFSLLGGESTVLYPDNRGHAALYDVDLKFVDAFPSLNSEKRGNPICLPAIQAEPIDPRRKAQSLYVLDLSSTAKNNSCFEVLSYRREGWCWDFLPPPPFSLDPETAPGVYSYAVIDSRSAICISSLEEAIGTYAFDTVSATWRRAADWALRFFGRAEYIPELGLWVGLSGSSPSSSLCALDPSGIDAARPPVPRHTWDYLDLPEAVPWTPSQLHLLNLGSGRFCVASFFGTMLRTYGRSKPPRYYDSDEEEEDTFGRE
ncbi:uncharacterized protein [Aegilops tauschii subsp. strangulata]|uniref:uncharacterized protein n=1 Tax=Aegilops tauschii subsp. strangulata TaxID=200361 RepID=UPI003CC86C62